MSEGNAVLLLLGVLGEANKRPIRVLDLYIYLRHALVPGAIPEEIRRVLQEYDSSMLFLVLERLRADGLVRDSGRGFELTDAGRGRVGRVRDDFPPAVASLRDVAAHLAA